MSAPARFGKFEVVAELGEGAMGRVYRARDPLLDREVALKTVSQAMLPGKDTLARFEREARAVARLQHPNVVTVYEVGEAAGTRYIAMELVEGMDLAEAMTPADRFPLETKVRMMVDVCRGLDYAHRMGIVHRDVKPPNIRVRRDGVVKIVDFGIARLADSSMTQTGVVLGTPSYVAPELLKGAPVDRHADTWAVAVILYEMVAGRRPFEAETVGTLVQRIVSEPLPPLDAKALGIPEALAAAITRALDKDPNARFPDAAAFASALLAAINAAPLPEPAGDAAVRRRATEAKLAEARDLIDRREMAAALAAAQTARRLEPGNVDAAALVKAIQSRLGTQARVRPVLDAAAVADGSAAAQASQRPPAPGPPSIPSGPLDSSVLRARAAAALRDLGTFGEPPATREAALSPVADLLVLAGADGALRVWDLHARTRRKVLRSELHQRTGHDAAALSLAFSPDGSLLASGHVDGLVHLWDVTRGEEVPVRLRHDASVGAIAFSPDGATLATGSFDASLRLWDVGAALSGEPRRELVRQPSGVTALAWAEGGEQLITGHASRVLRVTDVQRGRLLATLRGAEGLVDILLVSPDGSSVAAASQDRMVRLFDVRTHALSVTLGPLRRPARSLCFLPDGSFLATACLENSVQLWELASETATTALWGPADEAFTALALFGDANHVAVALADGRIRVWAPAS